MMGYLLIGTLLVALGPGAQGGSRSGLAQQAETAAGAKPEPAMSPETKRLAGELKESVAEFRLTLTYSGSEGKPFYRLLVTVPEVAQGGADAWLENPFYRVVRLSENQAAALIDHLAAQGFLDRAHDPRTAGAPPKNPVAGYFLNIWAGDTMLRAFLGWDLEMIHRLEQIREGLPEVGRKEMDPVLARLSGLRAAWEAEAKMQADTNGQ